MLDEIAISLVQPMEVDREDLSSDGRSITGEYEVFTDHVVTWIDCEEGFEDETASNSSEIEGAEGDNLSRCDLCSPTVEVGKGGDGVFVFDTEGYFDGVF